MPDTTPLHPWFQSQGAQFLNLQGVELPVRVAGAGKEYEAARNGLAFADGGHRAWLEVTGGDSLDYLNRLLTNDVKRLDIGNGQWSASLNGKGHWIADLLVFRTAEHGYALDLPAWRVEAFLAVLERMHFGEDVQWQAMPCARILVLGPEELGLGLELPQPTLHSAQPDLSCSPCTFSSQEMGWFLSRPDMGATCHEWLGPVEDIEGIAQHLLNQAATPAGWAALDILRVEAGLPFWGIDFSEETILPSTAEWHRACLSKGCYPGQEVVAKVNTYGSAPQQLCRLLFEEGTTPLHGKELLTAEGDSAGQVTSWVWSPLVDGPVGLGIVRRKFAQDGTLLQVQGKDAHLISCQVETRKNSPVS